MSLIRQKNDWATFWAIFHKLIWSPWQQFSGFIPTTFASDLVG
jgi:hypothetical protein